MRISRVYYYSLILVLGGIFSQSCRKSIDEDFVSSIKTPGLYLFDTSGLGLACNDVFKRYLALKQPADVKKAGGAEFYAACGGIVSDVRPYLTHLKDINLFAPKLCQMPEYYLNVQVLTKVFGLQKRADGTSKYDHLDDYKPFFVSDFVFDNAAECNEKGINIPLTEGINVVRFGLFKKPVGSAKSEKDLKVNNFVSPPYKDVAYIIASDKPTIAQLAGTYKAEIDRMNAEAAAKVAEEEKDTTTKDSAYRVFLNTAHLPDQILTSDALRQNEKHYTGKKFYQWSLKVTDESGGCIEFAEPQTGFNWGRFCGASDVAGFKAKYPNFGKGTVFIVKSGTIKGWLIGIHLTDLTF